MPFDPTDLFLEDFVPESGFEFTLAKGCGGHGHGLLATTEEDLRQKSACTYEEVSRQQLR